MIEINAVYAELAIDRIRMMEHRNTIEHLEHEPDAEPRLTKLRIEGVRKHLALMHKAKDLLFRIPPLVAPAVLSARLELELPSDEAAIRRVFELSTKKHQQILEEFIGKLEALLAQEENTQLGQ